eukprot:723595-Pelagomonas_calceolata.AAC.1
MMGMPGIAVARCLHAPHSGLGCRRSRRRGDVLHLAGSLLWTSNTASPGPASQPEQSRINAKSLKERAKD